jgi:hypothetical protein
LARDEASKAQAPAAAAEVSSDDEDEGDKDSDDEGPPCGSDIIDALGSMETWFQCDACLAQDVPEDEAWYLFEDENNAAGGHLEIEECEASEKYTCQACIAKGFAAAPLMSPAPSPPVQYNLAEESKKLISTAVVRNARLVPVALLRALCDHHRVGRSKDEGRWKVRKELEALLIEKLGLADAASAKEETSESTKMGLFKMKQLLYHMQSRFDGAAKGGGNLRREIAALCRIKYFPEQDDAEVNDDVALARACKDSTFFKQLLVTFDVELWLAVCPVSDWEDGDISTFLQNIPAMLAFIASGRKPKVVVLVSIVGHLKIIIY